MMKTLITAGALLMASNALAAANGQLTITGTVANNTYLSLTDMGPNDASIVKTLDVNELVNGASTSKTFSDVMYEVSNSTGGYKITVSSANAGELVGPGSNSVKYSLDYSSAKISIADCSLTAPCEASSGGLTAKTSSAVAITVKTTSTAAEVAALPSGTYSDTVTVTIAAQ